MQNPTLDSTRILVVPKVPTGYSGTPTGFVINGSTAARYLQWNTTGLFWDTIRSSNLITALLPNQSGNAGYFLGTDGFGNLSWQACCVSSVFGRSGAVTAQTGDYNFTQISGTAQISQGGTSSITQPGALKNLTPDTTGKTSQVLTIIPGGGIGWSAAGGGGTGTVTSVNVSGGSTGLTFSGGPVTTTGTITAGGALVVSNGGTGITSYTAGDIPYATGTSTMSKVAIGSSTQVLGSTGSAPSYVQNGATIAAAETTPSALAANTNDMANTVTTTVFRLSNSTGGAIDLTGIDASSSATGRTIILKNVGSQPIVLKSNNTGSLATNRFQTHDGSDVILAQHGVVVLEYDGTTQTWWEAASNN